uniref:Uncharacterized protein n=1 Tax=Solanum tuberosum TaxID=4113 RepID=M1DNH4_SOLTU
MSFLKGFVGPGELPVVQAPQAPANLPIAISVPNVGGTRVAKKCATKDHSAQSVGITDPLGDPPFGQFHRLSALAFVTLGDLVLYRRIVW